MNRATRRAQTQDRARLAVTEFRKLQPTLTAYARNLTGKRDVQVVMSTTDNGSTDGKKIYFRPPIKLGDMTSVRHEKSLCDKRDPESLELYCQACSLREQILATIYHEIAHIAFDSFAAVTKTDAKSALQMIEKISPRWYFERCREAFVKSPTVLRGKQSFIDLAQAINPYFKLLNNALEDVRINERMAEARPGTRIMQNAKLLRTANEGVEQKDKLTGKMVHIMWAEYPINHQACLAALCVASGFGSIIDDWFEEQVVEAVRDEKLTSLLNEVKSLTGAQAVFEHSFEIFMRFREKGFFFTKDEEPPPAPETQPEESDGSDSGSDGSDSAGEDNAGSDSSDSGASSGGASGSDESDADRGGSERHTGDEQSRAGSGSSSSSGLGSDDERSGDGRGDDSADGRDEQAGNEDSSSDGSPSNGRQSDGVDADDQAADGDDASAVGEDSGAESEVARDDTEPEPLGDAGDGDSDVEGADPDGGSDADLSPTVDGEGDADSAEPDDGESDGAKADRDDLSGSGEAGDGSEDGSDAHGVQSDDGFDAGTGPEAGTGEAEGDRSELLDSDDELGEPGEQSAEGSDGLDSDDLGADPLDYLPDEEAAIDLTDREPFAMVPPTIESDEDLGLIDLGLHVEVDEPEDMSEGMEKAVGTAIIQSIYFEMPSQTIAGLNVWKYDNAENDADGRPWHAWGGSTFSSSAASRRGQVIDPVGEDVLGPALMRMRVVFSDNQRSHRNRNMRSGKIDTRSLGKRAWSGDDRLFGRKVLPRKKDYFVALFLDVSGSTRGVNLKMIKEAALAQAELCHRIGISFAVYAHTGSPSSLSTDYSLDVDLYEVKAPEQAWDNKTREALMALNPSAANLDGHTLEFARKLCDAQTQTNKVILYYSDGAMPLENFHEELDILRREISTCKSKGYTLLGVGVRTDSPAKHGVETVQINDSAEVGKVVTHLERHLVS